MILGGLVDREEWRTELGRAFDMLVFDDMITVMECFEGTNNGCSQGVITGVLVMSFMVWYHGVYSA
jgi:hypothetical protein